jgi:hypothetical protein
MSKHLTPLNEKRKIAIRYLKDVLEVEREIVFGCDTCGVAEGCEFAFDLYCIDDDCLAEK